MSIAFGDSLSLTLGFLCNPDEKKKEIISVGHNIFVYDVSVSSDKIKEFYSCGVTPRRLQILHNKYSTGFRPLPAGQIRNHCGTPMFNSGRIATNMMMTKKSSTIIRMKTSNNKMKSSNWDRPIACYSIFCVS